VPLEMSHPPAGRDTRHQDRVGEARAGNLSPGRRSRDTTNSEFSSHLLIAAFSGWILERLTRPPFEPLRPPVPHDFAPGEWRRGDVLLGHSVSESVDDSFGNRGQLLCPQRQWFSELVSEGWSKAAVAVLGLNELRLAKRPPLEQVQHVGVDLGANVSTRIQNSHACPASSRR
jgi:hypothetical protein